MVWCGRAVRATRPLTRSIGSSPASRGWRTTERRPGATRTMTGGAASRLTFGYSDFSPMIVFLSLVAVTTLGGPVPSPVVAFTTTPVMARFAVGDTLRGRLADSTGAPIATAQITLVELARGATTNARGEFVFV